MQNLCNLQGFGYSQESKIGCLLPLPREVLLTMCIVLVIQNNFWGVQNSVNVHVLYNTNLMFFSVQLHKSGFLSSVVWYCPLKRCNAQIFHFAALISNYVFLWYKELYCTLASSVLVKHEDTFCVCKIYPELSTQIIRKGL